MTIQEGRQVIAQAITDCCIKARGPGYPHVNLLKQQPFRFDHPRGTPIKDTPGMVALTVNHCHAGPLGAKTTIDVGGTKGLHCFGYPHLPQTEGSRVTGAHYQWLHPCCPCQIDQRDHGVSNKADDTERMGPYEDKPPCLQGQGC